MSDCVVKYITIADMQKLRSKAYYRFKVYRNLIELHELEEYQRAYNKYFLIHDTLGKLIVIAKRGQFNDNEEHFNTYVAISNYLKSTRASFATITSKPRENKEDNVLTSFIKVERGSFPIQL